MKINLVKKVTMILPSLLSVLFFASIAGAETFNVSTSVEFQEALEKSREYKKDNTILMAPGVYKISENVSTEHPTGSEFDYFGKKDIFTATLSIQGAGIGKTIIDGEGKREALIIRTLPFAENIQVKGITFRNGDGSLRLIAPAGGGAITTDGASIAIQNCEFIQNNAKALLDEVEVLDTSDERLYTNLGGAIGVYRSDVVKLINNIFSGNSAAGDGGAVVLSKVSKVEIINNTFYGNKAEKRAGSVFISPNEKSSLKFINNIFFQNAANQGADIFLEYSKELHGAESKVILSHNNLFDFVCSDLTEQGLCNRAIESDSNIKIDPSFVNAGVGDFHLSTNSPMIDVGTEDEGMPDRRKIPKIRKSSRFGSVRI